MQIADIRTVSQPDIRVRIGQDLLIRPTKITDLDRAERGHDVPRRLHPRQPAAIRAIGIGGGVALMRDRERAVFNVRTR
jgi:hypothetical protein